MKKLLLALTLLATSTVALADGYGHHNHGGYQRTGGDWIAPAIIGGVIGYAISQPRTVYVQPAPVVVYQQPQVVYAGQMQPYGYHYEDILDSYCNCYRRVLVPNY